MYIILEHHFPSYTEAPASSLEVPDGVLIGVIQHDLVSKLNLLLDQAVSQLNTLAFFAAPFFMQCNGLKQAQMELNKVR